MIRQCVMDTAQSLTLCACVMCMLRHTIIVILATVFPANLLTGAKRPQPCQPITWLDEQQKNMHLNNNATKLNQTDGVSGRDVCQHVAGVCRNCDNVDTKL